MSDNQPGQPRPQPGAWTYPAIPPQRYSSNYEKYIERGGLVRIENLAKRYTNGQPFEDSTRFFLLCHIFDQIFKEGLAGDFIEIGVYKGDTGVMLADMARILGKTAYLLDTYEGFDERDLQGIDDGRKAADFIDTSLDAVRQRIGTQSANFIKGYFPETASHLPPDGRYSLVHIDCDLYKPVISSLEYFYPRVVPGGFIVVHDYSSYGWDGAEKAVDDFFVSRSECVIPVPDSAGSAIIRKVRNPDGHDNWRARKKELPLDVWMPAGAGNLATILDKGWSIPEDWGIWGVGDTHHLSFVVTGGRPNSGFTLDLDIHAALFASRTRQSLTVTVNDEERAKSKFSIDENRGVRSILLGEEIKHGDLVKIVLEPEFTGSPHDMDPTLTETRRLGIALHGLRLWQK